MTQTKGRSQELIERRNRKLIERYYHLTEVERRRFDDVTFTLSYNEFFIAEHTIGQIIKQNLHLIDELCEGKKVFTTLKPHCV
jgi:hypothetical protein